MMRGLQLALIVGLLFFQQNLFAQDSKPPLKEQMEEIMDKGRTYNQYKVIPITRLQELFDEVNMTLEVQETQIKAAAEAEKMAQAAQKEGEVAKLAALRALSESELRNESISFLGVEFSKSSYNVMVWGIICLLIGGILILYVLFSRSHKVTKSVQGELHSINEEFETYKTKSHEKQVKLKRELQTAMNTLHEKGIKL